MNDGDSDGRPSRRHRGESAAGARSIWIAGAVLVAGFLVVAFWPRPTAVETAVVDRGALQVELVDEGRALPRRLCGQRRPGGRVLRVDVDPGDRVAAGAILAQMTPGSGRLPGSAQRSAKTRASVDAADAARRAPEPTWPNASTSRSVALRESRLVSEAAVDQGTGAARCARAEVASAEAELERPQRLLRPVATARHDPGARAARASCCGCRRRARRWCRPARRWSRSATRRVSRGGVPVPGCGADAARLCRDDRGWGGPPPAARVQRVEPVARTKISALGVEEQRTNVILDFVDLPACQHARPRLSRRCPRRRGAVRGCHPRAARRAVPAG